MTTYANIKLSEIFALYGNPFTRGTCKKNIKAKLLDKYFKKIDFEEIVQDSKQTKANTNVDGNGISKIELLSKNNNQILSLKNVFTEQNNKNKFLLKLDHLFPKNGSYKHSSQIHLNTDSYSVSSQKKRTQQELIKKTRANYNSEDNFDNTKMSSVFIKKIKENRSYISPYNII
jgi:hypothetical protein